MRSGAQAAGGIAMSSDGETLASGHWDIVKLWNVSTGKRLATLRGFGRYVGGMSFSPDGKLLAAGTDAGGLQIWDVSRLTKVASLDIGGGEVSVPRFSPDGRFVAVGIYGTGAVWLIEVATGKLVDHQRVSDKGGTIRVFRISEPTSQALKLTDADARSSTPLTDSLPRFARAQPGSSGAPGAAP